MKLQNMTRSIIRMPSGHTLEPGEVGEIPVGGDNANFVNGQLASRRLAYWAEPFEVEPCAEEYPDNADGDI